jgi:hypothetical protein
MTPPFPNSPRPAWYRQAQWEAAYSKRNGVHYVGDEVIIDLTFPTASYNTFQRTAIFDNGTDAATISTSDRGYYTNVATVTGSPSYSSTHAYGDLAALIPSGTNQNLRWDYLSSTDHYGRVYLYATTNPSPGVRVLGGNSYSIGVDTSGRPVIIDQGSTSYAMTNSISLNQWIRLEWHADHTGGAGASSIELKLFNSPDSGTATETKLQSAITIGPNSDTLLLGNFAGSNWGSNYWVDNIVERASSYPGPYDPAAAPADPLTYTVRSFYGEIVSTGTIDESQAWFQPGEPSGGWDPGWYRAYLTGPQSDANFYSSYGATNFCVIRSDAHFTAMPVASTVGGYNGETPDLVMKGVMGMGTSRLIISDAASPATDIANAQLELAITNTYWCDNGIPDAARPIREPWCTFPNGGANSPAELAGVTATVAALYPDCKYYEGPENEPPMGAGTAALMQDFADAVHAGHADALAIGPSFVQIGNLTGWDGFLGAGGGDACDGISFHAYNAVTNGDMNLGNSTIPAFLELLASYGLQDKELWQTESVHGFTPVYRIYHPRRARKPLMETLLFERYGVPRERNNQWYDQAHGFWSFPSWLENSDGSLEPQAVLSRVLAEETWGKVYSSALDFGTPGNNIFLGHVYTGSTGSTLVLMATSYMDGASITLTITGTSSVTVVDGWGNATVTAPSQGRVTVPMTEVPAYVELPVGAQAGVYRINDWAPGLGGGFSSAGTTKEIDGVSYPVIANDAFMTDYGAGTGIAPTTFATPPSVTRVLFPTSRTVERVIVWCGPTWQSAGTLVSFDVQTTTDGTNWTTRRTITKPTPDYFEFGTDETNSGCFLETYWDEQWIFDIKLPNPVTCTGVRLNVTEASFGGEPLSDTTYGAAFGQGTAVQAYKIEEIGIYGFVSGTGKPGRRVGKGSAW